MYDLLKKCKDSYYFTNLLMYLITLILGRKKKIKTLPLRCQKGYAQLDNSSEKKMEVSIFNTTKIMFPRNQHKYN